MHYARVAVPVPLGRAFTYRVPDALERQVCRGARVLCEFGRRRLVGVVLELTEDPGEIAASKVKPLEAVVDPEPVLPEELLAFLVELSQYYLAPIGEVIRLALPAVEREAARDLESRGLLEDVDLHTVGRLVQVARPVGVEPDQPLRGQAREVLRVLVERGAVSVRELERQYKSARGAIKRLESLGLVSVERRPAEVDPFFAEPAVRDVPPELTPAQAEAVGRIAGRLDAGERGAILLHGVTASGKTEVYLRAVARCLEKGRGAIVLVPEIALTPQLVARFRARLGDAIAVLHSGLGQPDRQAMWRALRSGKTRVAIGARSALFAPVPDLSLLVVDEEHDPSFKQEEGVRYNARDMALLRAHRAGALCILGSATPSLSSEALVRAGKLERLVLPERARKASALPTIEVVDLRRVGPGPSGDRLLSARLFRELERVLDAKEQAILFLNRRGFAPSVVCDECGQVCECPNCSVALTLHRSHGERLVCHYCDYWARLGGRCSSCRSEHLVQEGAGTERIEQALKSILPEARVARLDRDVAEGLKSEQVLDRVRRREVDILVGTQMVTKGHDLPAVTLVGVLNADAALSLPDFRAAERTFHLLVQVAGRAGRGESPGKVLIQTRNPTHPAVSLALRHDVAGFVEHELGERRDLGYPPYARLALVRLDAVEEARVRDEAARLAALARRAAPSGAEVLGPAPAPLLKLRNRYRYRFLVRSPHRPPLRRALLAVSAATTDRRVRVSIDIDPMSML